LDLKKSVFVGDTFKDLEAGSKAGCRTILVKTGQGRETLGRLFQSDDCRGQVWITGNLSESIDLIQGMMTTD
jgi:histidinol phosphatase-like enzyme